MIVSKTVTKDVRQCYQDCLHYETNSDGMYCGHPFFGDLYWDRFIITHANARDGKFPIDCPLMKGKPR